MYGGLALVGLGSTALHVALTAPAQAADELPMLLFNVALLAALAERGCPRGGGLRRGALVPLLALGTSAVVAFVYLR
jgi:hypothetical protein